MMQPFSSPEKSVVRERCLQLVELLRGKTKRPLSYLGLPSPWMVDITAWHPHLGNVFAVELEELFIPSLVDQAYTLGLLHQLSYYVGDIDKILQSGKDNEGRDISNIFPIDLVNLDYCSGLIYEGFERIAAIESLFRWQAKGLSSTGGKNFPYFLLFITHNSDPKAGKQTISRDYIAYLTSKEASLYQGSLQQELHAAVEWYLSDKCPPEYRHKVFVFGKVLEFAQAAGFKISIKNAIAYKGDHQTPMVHYQFEAYPHSIGHPIPVDSHINVCDIINWPVIDVSGRDIASNDRPRVALS